jgi:hypothetical protein
MVPSGPMSITARTAALLDGADRPSDIDLRDGGTAGHQGSC